MICLLGFMIKAQVPYLRLVVVEVEEVEKEQRKTGEKK